MVRDSREDWKTYGNVFDNYTRRLLFKLASQGHFEELKSEVSPGKEANVFTARTKDGFVIVKIYRLEQCNFNQMYSYIRQDPRYVGLSNNRRKTIFAWAQREFRNLLKAREAVRVPTPIVHKDHVIVMELIGHKGTVARMLKDDPPEDPEAFFDLILKGVERLWKEAKLVHGDLSEFNILNYDEKPVMIDLSQATTTECPQALELLERDLKNLCRFFKKLGVKREPETLLKGVLE